MTNRSALRDRYLRDSLPVRLGGLAANLARVRSFSDNPIHGDVVVGLLEESTWFIEWTAPDAPLNTQITLVECQRALARWRLAWAEIWANSKRRAEVVDQAGAWSQKLLSLSGLVQAAFQGSGSHRA